MMRRERVVNVARKFTLPVFIIAWLNFSAALPARSEDSTNQAKSAVETAREEARQRRAKLPIAKGGLKEIDLLRRQLKLQTEDGMRTFTYTARTYIFRDKDKITVDKLKVGEIIAVRFGPDKDGNITVSRIKATTTPPTADVIPSAPPAATNQPPNGLP
jgi:Cu/Ag efflux protein CusF